MKISKILPLLGLIGATLAAPASAWAQAPTVPSNPNQPGVTTGAVQIDLPPPPRIRPGEPITLLVYPLQRLDAGEGTAQGGESAVLAAARDAEELRDFATAAVKAGFLSTPAYSLVSYHRRSPLVRRALSTQLISGDDLETLDGSAPSIDLAKARTVAQRLQLQTILVGSYEVTPNPERRTAAATLQAQIVDSVTGATLRSAAVTGAASGNDTVTMHQIERAAIQDAVTKLLPSLGIELVAAPTDPAPPQARSRRATPAQKASAAAAKAARESAKAMEAARKAARTAGGQSSNSPAAAPRTGATAAAAARPAGAAAPASPGAAAASGTVKVELDAQPAEAPAATPSGRNFLVNPSRDSARGVSDPATGAPVPYGYAMQNMKESAVERDRSSLRVPPWVGLASFLIGVSFLL